MGDYSISGHVHGASWEQLQQAVPSAGDRTSLHDDGTNLYVEHRCGDLHIEDYGSAPLVVSGLLTATEDDVVAYANDLVVRLRPIAVSYETDLEEYNTGRRVWWFQSESSP